MEFKKFDKSQRSSFRYWFEHWKAFNYTAYKLGVWKPKYLLHDIEKPWLKLIWKDYKKVQKWHRYHSSHHMQYAYTHGFDKIDWLGMVIDNECSRLTKKEAPLTARQWYEYVRTHPVYTEEEFEYMKYNYLPILDKLGL